MGKVAVGESGSETQNERPEGTGGNQREHVFHVGHFYILIFLINF